MGMFGLVITTEKRLEADRAQGITMFEEIISGLQEKAADVTADRDAANKQIARLLHYSCELITLWNSIRETGHEKQIRQVYERLMGGK